MVVVNGRPVADRAPALRKYSLKNIISTANGESVSYTMYVVTQIHTTHTHNTLKHTQTHNTIKHAMIAINSKYKFSQKKKSENIIYFGFFRVILFFSKLKKIKHKQKKTNIKFYKTASLAKIVSTITV